MRAFETEKTDVAEVDRSIYDIRDAEHDAYRMESGLTPEIVGLTGITDAMLADAPQLKEALTSFLEFVGDRPLAAHNAEFDISFIRAGCRKVGLPFDPTYVDSLILAQNLLPELHKYKLDIVA